MSKTDTSRRTASRDKKWKAFDELSDEEVNRRAMDDPDCPPSTPEQLRSFKRVPAAKRIRRKLVLTQEAFAERFQIPLGTLRDWEQGRNVPDDSALAYLKVIEHAPDAVVRALEAAALAEDARKAERARAKAQASRP